MIWLLFGMIVLFAAAIIRVEGANRRISRLVDTLRDQEVISLAKGKSLGARVTELEPSPTQTPTLDPSVAPAFVSGPSCAVCHLSIDPTTAIEIATEFPMPTGRSIPATLLIHQHHAEIV